MWPNPQETANSVTFTEEILNGKLQYLCSACWYIHLSLNIISTYLVLVLLFKDHWGFVHELLVCSLKIERYLFRDKSSWIFIYFVLSTLVFANQFCSTSNPYVHLRVQLIEKVYLYDDCDIDVGTPNYLQM